MQGLGNDFVIIDATSKPVTLSVDQIHHMADRHLGIGFDQLLVIEPPPQRNGIDYGVRIYNADGSEVEQCGNGMRCVAAYIKRYLSDRHSLTFRTINTEVKAEITDCAVSITMGEPSFDPRKIPFLPLQKKPPYEINVEQQTLFCYVVSLGNPHVIFTVKQLVPDRLELLAPLISQHEQFLQGVNVGFMKIASPDHVDLRVFERGAGWTQACGSGACAAMAVGRQQGWLEQEVTVSQPGGDLQIHWPGQSQQMIQTGPATFVYCGEILL